MLVRQGHVEKREHLVTPQVQTHSVADAGLARYSHCVPRVQHSINAVSLFGLSHRGPRQSNIGAHLLDPRHAEKSRICPLLAIRHGCPPCAIDMAARNPAKVSCMLDDWAGPCRKPSTRCG